MISRKSFDFDFFQREKDTEVGTNYWQFQKSDNSFLFNFDNAEST